MLIACFYPDAVDYDVIRKGGKFLIIATDGIAISISLTYRIKELFNIMGMS
jgi:hypothetical protein